MAPERLGFRFGLRERLESLRPIAAALGLFLLIGVPVLALYERMNRARHEASAGDRRELHEQARRGEAERAALAAQVRELKAYLADSRVIHVENRDRLKHVEAILEGKP